MYEIINILETICRLLVVMVFNYTLALPSQIIFGIKNADRLGVGLSVKENSEILTPLWHEETVMGRTSKRLADWAIG